MPIGNTDIDFAEIQSEFGGSNPISLSEYYKGGGLVANTDTAPNIPASGVISLSNFAGAQQVPVLDFIVAGGGGGGGNFTGGGSGAVLYKTGQAFPKGTYTFTIGAGGTYPSRPSTIDGDGTRVYSVSGINGNSGGTTTIVSGATTYVTANGGQGGGLSGNSNVGGDSGTGSSNFPSVSVYRNDNVSRGGGGAGSGGSAPYTGGSGVSLTLGSTSFTMGGGGSGGAYWNVGGSTGGGGTQEPTGVGGISGRVAGDRNGVHPSAGQGDPPPNTPSYIRGGNGSPNTGSGGGSGANAETIFGIGEYGSLGGNGADGVVIIGYPSATVKPYGGQAVTVGNYTYHRFTSTTTVSI